MKFGHLEGEQTNPTERGLTITMAINHMLTGMILQAQYGRLGHVKFHESLFQWQAGEEFGATYRRNIFLPEKRLLFERKWQESSSKVHPQKKMQKKCGNK